MKNTGCKPLFRFIAEALRGEFRADLRPCKIRLFGISHASEHEQDIYNDPATWQFSEDLAVSPCVYHNSADIINESQSADNPEYVEASYTFKIPSNVISADKIYKIALYPNSVTDFKSQRCAYIGKIGKDDWEPLQIDNNTGNYALEIK